jgi:PAS domain S-box-containing protein
MAKDSGQTREQLLAELAAIHAHVPMAMMLVDPLRRVRKVNAAAALFAGRAEEEMAGLFPGEALRCLHHLDDPRGCGAGPDCASCPVRLAVADTLATGTSHTEVEAWLPFSGGDGRHEKCLLVSTACVELGGQRHALVCAQDITARKRAEEALRRSEERLELILRHSTDGINIAEFDPKTTRRRLVLCNDPYVRMSGFSREDLMAADDLNRLVHAYDDPRKAEEDYRKIVEGIPFTGRGSWLRPDGKENYYEWTAAPIRVGSKLYIVGIDRDVTGRHRAERALRESEERFRTLMEYVPGISIQGYQTDGTVVYWNRASESVYGYTAEEAVGKNLSDLIVPPALKGAFRKCLALGKKATRSGEFFPAGELLLVRKDGSFVPVYSIHAVVCIEGREPVLFCIDVDLSERKRVEEEKDRLQAQLLQAQKVEAVGRLAGGVAHDFNNQLTVIQGYCAMLLDRRGPDDPLWGPLSEIRRAAERARATTSHLLSFSRKQVLHPEVTDLGELLLGMRGPVSRIIGEDVRLSVVAPPGVRPVHVDRTAMHQTLMNLIVNARDAMPTGGELTLRISNLDVGAAEKKALPNAAPGPHVLLEVCDTGVGMDRKTLERMFDPFFTTKDVGKGTGLGMTMVHGFVRQSRGRIDVRSQPDRGTTVGIVLPAAVRAPRAASRPARAPAARPKGRGTVLVVEDEEGVRGLMVRCLQEAGYRVLVAASPAEAIALAREHARSIDLLVTDIVLPEMKGTELARRVKGIHKSIRTLFVTGYMNEDAKGPVRNVLYKPFDPADLAARVRKTLGARRIGRKA